MYALQKYSESNDIELTLSLAPYQTCDTKALLIIANGTIITVMFLHYVSRKRNSDPLLCKLFVVKKAPFKNDLIGQMGSCINTSSIKWYFCCNKNKLKYMFVKDACHTK